MIEKEFPRLRTRQINVGVDGEWIADLLDSGRYVKCVTENYPKVDVVFVRYGANDTKRYDAETFKARLRELCGRLRRDYPGVTIVLGTGPFVAGVAARHDANWQAVRDVAREDGCILADIYKRFEKEDSEATAIRPGNMHPSALGVRLAAEEEFAAIRDVLRRWRPTSAKTDR